MARARHRKQYRSMKVTTWLTAGATTVGVGAALLSGAAIANAKPSSDSSSSASSSSSAHSGSSSGSSTHKSHKHSPKKTDSGSSSDSGSGGGSSNSGSSGGSGSDSGSGSGGSTGSSGSGSTSSAAASSSSDSSASTTAASKATKTTKTSKAKHSNNKHTKTDTDKNSVSTTTAAASGTSPDAPTGKHVKPANKHVAAAATDAADTSTTTASNNDASGSSSASAASALAAVSASATTASSTTTTGGTSTVKTTGTRTADFSGVLSVLAAVGQALSVSARNSELTLTAYAHNTELTLTHDLVGTAKTINAAATALAAGISSLTTVPAANSTSATSTASTATTAASTDDDTNSSLYAGTSSDPQVAQALTEIQAAQAAYNAAVKKSWWASFTNGMAGYYLSVAKKDLLKYQANQDNLLAAYTANPTTKNYNALAANEKLTTSAYSALKSAASSSSIATLKTNAKAASTDAHIYGTVSMSLYLGTEAIVKISINGGPMSKVLLDSGSTGLVIASKYVGNAATMTSTGSGTSAYGTGSGDTGVTFGYTTYTTSVSFGSGITGDSVTVNVVNADTQAAFLKYIGQDGVVGVLGIGTNAVDNQVPVTSGLLGELGNGVYINEKTKTVTFGPNPLPVRVTASGTPNSTGYISINGGTQTAANFILDSGGVYGTITAGAAGDAATSTGYLAVGTVVAVYNADHELLYTYTVTKSNSPTVTADASTSQSTVDGVTAYVMNSGYQGFALGPVYIDYLNGSTTITDSEGNVSTYVGETDYDLWTS